MSIVDGIENFLGITPTTTYTNSLRDWPHASRLFVADTYRLAPKSAWLFYVSFQLDPTISLFGTGKSQEQLEAGMLVKSADLPKFTFDTKVMNAYNRTSIVQNKVKYDPITIELHDDSADVVRDFWYNYYHYYYRDSDYNEALYNQPDKYDKRQTQAWGYSPRSFGSAGQMSKLPPISTPVGATGSFSLSSLFSGGAPNVTSPPAAAPTTPRQYKMITSIHIYSLHQKKFSEYVLLNPTITAFQHGQHQTGGNDVMQNTMTLAYEAVLYGFGDVKADATVDGFATLHYDKSPSPLTPQGGGTTSILGPGGLLASADTIANQLGQGNYLGAALAGFNTFSNFKGQNVGAMAGAEIGSIATIIAQGQNPLSKINIPSFGGVLNNGGSAQTSTGNPQTGGVGLSGIQVDVTPTVGPTSSVTTSPTLAATATSNGEGIASAAPVAVTLNDNNATNGPTDQGTLTA